MNVFVDYGYSKKSFVLSSEQDFHSLLPGNCKGSLYFNGSKLEQGTLLLNNVILNFLPTISGGSEIFIRTLTGKQITIDVQESDTISDVRKKISEKDTSAQTFKLYYAGKALEEGKTVKDYDISAESVLMMVVGAP